MSENLQPNQTEKTKSPESAQGDHMMHHSGFDSQGGGNTVSPPGFTLNAGESPVIQQKSFNGSSPAPIQRAVRISGGSKKVNESDYQKGGKKEGLGSRHLVSGMISDGVKRIFNDVGELENYANGTLDNVGDVKTQSGETYWYRLPSNSLTVLGERHHNPDGNVEDVINGLQTSRFVYEPYHEFTETKTFGKNEIGGGTQARTQDIESNLATGGLVDRKKFDPHLENIVIKAMTGTSLTRNMYMSANPAAMSSTDSKSFKGRATNNDYSIGDRIALYLSMAIHIAEDMSKFSFWEENYVESLFYRSGRNLKEHYMANKAELDGLMHTKDKDDLIGIYELTSANGFAILPMLKEFTIIFHEYGARYIEQLGSETGNSVLEAEGESLSGNLGAGLSDMNTAREEIMWGRVMEAKSGGYLVAGMGDHHHTNFAARLDKAGIPHEEVVDSLTRQKKINESKWT